ncbi:hypothetical protein C9374_010234 [Naegleria lovaniensis]|uniref:DNA (cytosine-5-)-methyltransferase n=1 Tax=Naegleria lovaniensis TaxID=51637 RepID=A0AA88GG59_NAELO|nr:uncharacterized protein C9374_010234 [Naegleria lovaniensis]KAG2374860.1 hypothetical protein C9374_010234 [Naegleria lovaniensis]
MSSTFLSYCNNNEEVIVISDEEENKVEGLLNEIQGHHHGEGHTNRQHDDEEEQGSSDDEAQKTSSSDDDNDDNDDHVQVIHSMIHSHTGGDENDETFLLHQFVIRNEQDHSLVALNDLLQDNDSKEIRKTHSIVYGRVIQVKNELPSHICIDMDTLDGIDALDEWISEKTEPANASEKIGYLLDVRVEYELCTRPILIFTIDRSNGSIECECLDPSDEYIEMYEKVYQRSCICHCLIESISTYPLGTYSKIMSAAKEFSQSLGVTITNSILLSHFSFIVNQFYRLNDPLILNSKFMIELTSLKLKGDSIEDDHLSSDNDELYEEENQTFKKPLTLNTKKRKQYSNVTRKHFKRKKQLTNSSPNSNDTQFSLSYLYDSSQNNIIGFEINGQTILEGESIYILPHEHLFPNFMRGNIDKSYPYLIYRVEFKGLEKSIYGRRLYRHYDMAFMCLGSDKNILTHDVHELMISSENVIELPIQNYFIRKCFVFYLTSAEEFVEISNDIRERRDVFYCISSVTISNSFKSYQLSPIDQLYITRMFELIDRYAEYLYENLIIELGCKKPLKGMDVFSGCGGLSYGLHKAGIQICYAVDSSIDAINNYQLNFKSSNTFQKNASKFLRKIKMINKLREICGMNYEMTSDDTLHPTNGTTSSRDIHNTINSDTYANNSITNNQKSSSTILKIKKFRVHHDRMEFKVIWDNTILKNKQWIYFSQLQQQAPTIRCYFQNF